MTQTEKLSFEIKELTSGEWIWTRQNPKPFPKLDFGEKNKENLWFNPFLFCTYTSDQDCTDHIKKHK